MRPPISPPPSSGSDGRAEQARVDGEHAFIQAVHVRLIDIGAHDAGVAVQAQIQAIQCVRVCETRARREG